MRTRKVDAKNKLFWVATPLCFLFILALWYFEVYKPAEIKDAVTLIENIKVVYPKQYSDQNITENAKVSDSRFKNLVKVDKEGFLANVVSSIKTPRPRKVDTGVENGTWLWTPILDITPQYRKEIIAGAKKHGVKNIYLSIDSYLDIYVLPKSPEKDRLKEEFNKIIEDFIAEANKNNITVDAEAGWKNWAEEGHWYKPFAVLNYAIEFNNTHSHKFRGFQFDVEPYLLEYYAQNKKDVLYNFVRLIDSSVLELAYSDLELSVVIPDFYDGTVLETPKFSYRGDNGYAMYHLLRVLERRPGSKIIVMSYRNLAKGDDGSIEVSEDEVQMANISKTKIIVAQETGDVLPGYITFYNTPRSYYKKQVKILQDTLSKEKSFSGIATHYVNSFLEMK